jgi:DNA-directed RNA polymerase alpha subunit
MKNEAHNQEGSDLPAELAAPAQRALAGAGIRRLEQLSEMSEAEVKQLHGIGKNAISQLQQALKDSGLSFAPGKPEPGKKEKRQ